MYCSLSDSTQEPRLKAFRVTSERISASAMVWISPSATVTRNRSFSLASLARVKSSPRAFRTTLSSTSMLLEPGVLNFT